MNIPVPLEKSHLDRIVFAVSVLSVGLVAVVCLREFLSQQLFNLVLGGLTVPFVLRMNPDKKGSYRFAVVALFFMALLFYAPVSTLVYFSLIAVLLFAAENRFGRVNFLTVATAILTMPLSTYLVNMFSFPIRLQLTSICGSIFRMAGIPVETAGNTFTYASDDFTFDPACMGLNMLISSFLVGILLFGFYQKKCNREMPVVSVIAYLIIILLLNIFSNLVRMMILVLFRVFPDTVTHDVVGISCFLVQIVLPAWVICRVMVKRPHPPRDCSKSLKLRLDYKFSRTLSSVEQTDNVERNLQFRSKIDFLNSFGSTCASHSENGPKLFPNRLAKDVGKKRVGGKASLVQIICCVLLWVVALQVAEKKERIDVSISAADVPGYTAAPFSYGVIKLENENSLVYVKQIRWFCDTEHNPMACWSGSGYTMSHVREAILGNLNMYTAVLQRDDDVLYTAWWYANGQSAVVGQLQWRRDMLFGAPAYSLINVTTADEKILESETAKIAELFAKTNGKILEARLIGSCSD